MSLKIFKLTSSSLNKGDCAYKRFVPDFCPFTTIIDNMANFLNDFDGSLVALSYSGKTVKKY